MVSASPQPRALAAPYPTMTTTFLPLDLSSANDRALIKQVFARTPSYVFATEGRIPDGADVDAMLDSVTAAIPGQSIVTRLIACERIPVAGFMLVARGYPDPATTYLVAVILTAEAQGRSLGVVALREAESLAADAGCHRLAALVDSANTRALRFWLKQGFIEERRAPAPRFTGQAVRIAKVLPQRPGGG